MTVFEHSYPFDPSYGYSLSDLLAIEPPHAPPGFEDFWRRRYAHALTIDPQVSITALALEHPVFKVWDLKYRSSDDFPIAGWLLTPHSGKPRYGFVLGHGYGGIDQPSFDLPCHDAVYLVPCFRGLCRSRRPPISDNPVWHVLHDVHLRERYILGGCVEDLWVGVSALLQYAPALAGHLGYMGISFGGGIGALALPWETRIGLGHLNVPTFGHQPLRLRLPTLGSAQALQAFQRDHGNVLATLAYYDAAVAARHLHQPMHIAAALFDPFVAPPGQFAIYNALPGDKQLFVLAAGHFDYSERGEEERRLLVQLQEFFQAL